MASRLEATPTPHCLLLFLTDLNMHLLTLRPSAGTSVEFTPKWFAERQMARWRRERAFAIETRSLRSRHAGTDEAGNRRRRG